jgi:hypothetical protein
LRSGSICLDIFKGAAVVASGYRRIQEITECTFQHASWAKRLRRVRKDVRAALPANSDYPDHCRSVLARSFLYSVKFCHTLRFEHRDEMTQLVFDVAGCGYGMGDLLAQ